VLVRALLNESDAQIAKSLGVSLDGVKKTWRRTYERLALGAPFLVGALDRPVNMNHRSAEKRRHLLDYLRTHLEELRPFTISGRQ
jgi:hypothetical protein